MRNYNVLMGTFLDCGENHFHLYTYDHVHLLNVLNPFKSQK